MRDTRVYDVHETMASTLGIMFWFFKVGVPEQSTPFHVSFSPSKFGNEEHTMLL